MKRILPLLSATLLCLTGCDLSVPSDPDGTLERVTGGVLRVGVSTNPPWTVAPEKAGEPPTGREVELVLELASQLEADVRWRHGGEEALMYHLDAGELDLVIGGLTEKSPWSTHAALTVPHSTSTDPDGDPVGVVVATPLGENAFMVTVERLLVGRGEQG